MFVKRSKSLRGDPKGRYSEFQTTILWSLHQVSGNAEDGMVFQQSSMCWMWQTCSASKDEHRLLSTLLDPVNYNRHIRPVIDHKKPVVVDVRLSLVEIIGLDETSGRLTLKLHLNLVRTSRLPGRSSDFIFSSLCL